MTNIELETPKVGISVYYVFNEKEMPDKYSDVYVYFKKKPENFVYQNYMGKGVFFDERNYIIPDKSLVVDSNGIIMFELTNDEAKNDFIIMVESNKTKIYNLTYFDEYRQGASLKAIFR